MSGICFIAIILFNYVPLAGWSIAFFRYRPGLSFAQMEFVGFFYFLQVFRLPTVWNALRNTLVMAGLGLATSWLPMVFAILLNEIRSTKYKRFIQTTTTLPNFISWVLVYAIFFAMFASRDGMVNNVLRSLGLPIVNPLANRGPGQWVFQWFVGTWKGLGWSMIIYLASIAGIDQEQYEAASIDGAGRFAKMRYITLPNLAITYFTLLIISIGWILASGFDQYFMFSNPMTRERLMVLDLFIYEQGIVRHNFAFATAVGMIRTVIGLTLLTGANLFSKKIRGTSIF